MSRQRYNEDEIDHWVTVRGARIPVLKDGTLGIGTKEDGTKVSASSGDTLENFEDVTEVLGRKIGWVNYRELSHDWNEFSKDPKKYKKSVVPDMVNLWADEKLKKLKEREKTGEVYKQSNPYGAQSVMNDDIDNRKPTSKNERYNTSRVGKKKPTALEAFKENSRQLNVALEEGQKRNALEVHYTDMTGKLYKSYWNGSKFTGDKVKQDMAKKYGKKAGIYKASFKKPKEWE